MRGGLPPDNAFLEVNDHQRRLGSVNECVFHNCRSAALGYGHTLKIDTNNRRMASPHAVPNQSMNLAPCWH
jgi:hypothetical protein